MSPKQLVVTYRVNLVGGGELPCEKGTQTTVDIKLANGGKMVTIMVPSLGPGFPTEGRRGKLQMCSHKVRRRTQAVFVTVTAHSVLRTMNEHTVF